MKEDAIRWNRRYEERQLLLGELPSRFLAESLPLLLALSPGRRVLDLACGEGRNSLFLAGKGFRVTGIDISERGLAKGKERCAREGLAVDFLRADLDDWKVQGEWDLMLNINFLMRRLFPQAVEALAPGGLLLVDTLMEGEGAPPPSHPEYLLKPGELRELFEAFPGEILHFRELRRAPPPCARILFRKTLSA